VSRREGEAEPDWSPQSGRRDGVPAQSEAFAGCSEISEGSPHPLAAEGSSRERCGAQGTPGLAPLKRAEHPLAKACVFSRIRAKLAHGKNPVIICVHSGGRR
jgi:hypothetical protein